MVLRTQSPAGSRAVRVGAALCLGALGLAGVAGCSSNSASANGNNGPRNDSGYVSGDGSAQVIPSDERKQAPDIKGTTLDGKQFDLSSLHGQVVALNVWASWCAPCRAEAPALDAVSAQLKDKGVTFVGLDTRDNDAAANAFIRRFAVPYVNVRDTDGALQLKFRDTLPPEAIPSTVIIDRDGRVAGRIVGPADRSQLRTMLTEIAEEGGQK